MLMYQSMKELGNKEYEMNLETVLVLQGGGSLVLMNAVFTKASTKMALNSTFWLVLRLVPSILQ